MVVVILGEGYVLLSADTHSYQRVSDPLEAGAAGSCESAYMGAGNRGWVLCRSSVFCYPLSPISSPLSVFLVISFISYY